MSGTLTQGKRRRLYASRDNESTYNGGATITHAFNTLPGAHLRVRPETVMDSDIATGVEGPQKQVVTRHIVPPTPVPMWATPEGTTFWLAKTMGVDGISAASAAYQHALTMTAHGTFPGSFSVDDHMDGAGQTTAINRLHLGVYVTELVIEKPESGIITVTPTIGTSGYTSTTAARTESGLVVPTDYIIAANAKVMIKAAGTAGTGYTPAYTPPTSFGYANDLGSGTALSDVLRTWRLTITNPLSDTRIAGQTTLNSATHPEFTAPRSVTFECTLAHDSTVTRPLVHDLVDSASNNLGPEWAIGIEMVSPVISGDRYKNVFILLPLAAMEQVPDDSQTLATVDESFRFVAKNTYTGTAYNMIYAYGTDGDSANYV